MKSSTWSPLRAISRLSGGLAFWLAGATVTGLCLLAPPQAGAATPIPLGRAASAAPELAFEPSAVVASGLLPEGEAIFHGVSRQ